MPEIVAEFTVNHCGNLNLLLRMVEEAAKAGADSIKMQKKDVEGYYTQAKLDTPYESPYGHTYRDYRTLFEFERHDDWHALDRTCTTNHLPWFATVQDKPSLTFLYTPWRQCTWGPRGSYCGTAWKRRWKVASSNARKRDFLQWLAAEIPTTDEIVVSVGGSLPTDIEDTLRHFDKHRRIYLLHCVAEYPCKPENTRLGNIIELKRLFETDRVRIGYSGHELGYLPTLAAVDLGAEMIERHFCLSCHSFVHHIECSLEPHEFGEMVQMIRGPKAAREAMWRHLPQEAFATRFGMTEQEEAFLVKQTYGDHYLGKRSRFEEDTKE